MTACWRQVLAMVWLATAMLAQAGPLPTPTRGAVVDEDGKPLAGVAVCAYRWGEPFVTADLLPHALAHTDRDGRFEIAPQQPPLECLLFVTAGRAQAGGPIANLGFCPVVLPKARVLAGVVRDRAGAPIAGARVEACDWLVEAPYLGSGERGNFISPRSAVRTDASGRFVLAGSCDTAMMLVVEGDGIEPLVLAPVAAGDPLAVTVDRFEPVVVTVSFADGKPAVGMRVTWGAEREPLARRAWCSFTDADGHAAAPVASVNRASCRRYRSEPYVEVDLSGEVAVASGVRAVTLRLAPAAELLQPEGEPIVVRAVDARGVEVARFSAAAVRCMGREAAASNLANSMYLCSQILCAAEHGVATFAPVGSGDHLQVLVDAPGWALGIEQVQAAPEVLAHLKPATVVTGRVVDAGNGAGIAGARVWTSPRLNGDEVRMYGDRGYGYIDPRLGTAVTDADGNFRLDRVPPGALDVLCALPGRTDPAPVPIAVAAGSTTVGLTIKAPPLLHVAGKTDLHELGPGFGIRLRLHSRPWSSAEDFEFTHSFPLAADGTFAIRDVSPGNYDAELLVSCGPRAGPPVKAALGRAVVIGEGSASIELPVADAMPKRLGGKVTGPVPPQRLAVISIARTRAEEVQSGGYLLRGPVCPLARDGSFALLEPSGVRTLAVFDLLTGVVLTQVPSGGVEHGAGHRIELPLTLGKVEVCVGVTGRDLGCTLEVRPRQPLLPAEVGGLDLSSLGEGYCGLGCRLLRGQQRATLYLPRGEFDLRLYPSLDERRPSSQRTNQAATAVAVEGGEAREVALELPFAK